MNSKIVLGFPYAGAFLWLLSAEEHYHKSIKESYDGTHPYYKTLFGRNHNLIIDETVSLTLLYDEIYLAPVDTYLPDREKYHISDTPQNQDWGIYFNWHWTENLASAYNQIDVLLTDTIVNNILKKIPPDAKRQILLEALSQIHISNTFDTAIFAIPSYLKLCKRINQLININPSELKTQSSTLQLDALDTVFNLASLKFSINGLEEFAMLKQEKNVRHYAKSFRQYVHELPNGNFDEKVLYTAMLEAINKDNISSKISGGLSLTSTTTGLVSLIPGVGTLAGAIGLASDASARISKKVSDINKWWLLSSEISSSLTKHRIEQLAKK